MASPRIRIRSIDALRGIAVLLVVFHHAYVPRVGVYAYDVFLSFFRHYGALGVDLFFLLSGFCIHGAYSKSGQSFKPVNYIRRRWWRIYPPYFFALSLAVFLNLATNFVKWKAGGPISWYNFGPFQILSHVFLVHDLSRKTMLTVSGPFWTIAMEMQYYLLYLALKPLFYDKKGWALLWISGFILYFAAWHVYYRPSPVQPFNPFCYWVEWLAGAFLVYLKEGGVPAPRFGRALVFFVSTAVILGVYGSGLVADVDWNRLVLTAGFAFLILLFLETEPVWSNPALGWLSFTGLFSYSVYLIHFLFLDRMRTFLVVRVAEGWPRLFASVSAVLLCLFVSYLFFLCFEKPYLEKAASVPKY